MTRVNAARAVDAPARSLKAFIGPCGNVQESWWREHQVLPFRTHPQMSTTGTGGYLLSGIKLAVQSSATPAVRAAQAHRKAIESPVDTATTEVALPVAMDAAQAEEPLAKMQKLDASNPQTPVETEPS